MDFVNENLAAAADLIARLESLRSDALARLPTLEKAVYGCALPLLPAQGQSNAGGPPPTTPTGWLVIRTDTQFARHSSMLDTATTDCFRPLCSAVADAEELLLSLVPHYGGPSPSSPSDAAAADDDAAPIATAADGRDAEIAAARSRIQGVLYSGQATDGDDSLAIAHVLLPRLQRVLTELRGALAFFRDCRAAGVDLEGL